MVSHLRPLRKVRKKAEKKRQGWRHQTAPPGSAPTNGY
jgi:hypothetical protein